MNADSRSTYALTSQPAVTITPYRDGPYIVRGSFKVLDDAGRELALGRRTVALCRCGKSRLRPLCDGTHRAIGFRAPGHAESYDGTFAVPDERS